MAGEPVITIVGNLTADPDLSYTSSGLAVTNFTVASTPRNYDRNSGDYRDGETLFMRCSVWREAAENVSESLRKGMRVIVQGRLVQRSFDTQQGDRRTVVELQVDEVGPSLRYAHAQVTRNQSQSNYQQGGYQGQGVQNSQNGNYQDQSRDGFQDQPGGGYQDQGRRGGYQQQRPQRQANYDAPAGGSMEDPWRSADQGGTTSFNEEPPF